MRTFAAKPNGEDDLYSPVPGRIAETPSLRHLANIIAHDFRRCGAELFWREHGEGEWRKADGESSRIFGEYLDFEFRRQETS